jgi:hypothetical protein
MLHGFLNCLGRCRANLLGAGFVSNSYGVATSGEGLGELLASSVLGGFVGLISGLIFTQIMRYLAFVSGRNFGGHVWTVVGTLLGAAAFAVIALTGSDE